MARPGPLPLAARLLRAAHTLITAGFLTAIGYVWWCALTGRRDRRLTVAVVALATEGTCVAVNHGDCPLGPLQDRVGDPVPLFELVLSPTAAKRAVPVLGAVAGAGILAVALRRPSTSSGLCPRGGHNPDDVGAGGG